MIAEGDKLAPSVTVASLGLRERRRLERDLHDGAQQRLVSLALTLRMARERLDSDPGETGRLLDRSREELDQALRELRELASGIHPAVLADRGLGAAVEALAERAPLPVYVATELPDRRLPERVELAAYFVVSEALTNVAKYASATQASVAVRERKGRLAVEVGDDGVGGADFAGGTGLRGLRDRLAAIDGRLDVDSKPGHGTTVRAVLPSTQPTAGRRLGARVGGPKE
jgi:signal transduction histidine kinase